MRWIATIIGILLSLTVVCSQTKEIRGKVLDKDDHSPIAGAIIQVRDSTGNTCQYTITNDKGEFGIGYPPSIAVHLYIQYIGYQVQEIGILEMSSPLIIYLVSQPIRLRDVVVKAPDIEQRSDTLTYHMSKYATAEDKKIADVLKRLPGIKVEDSGLIKYNGEPINKFYINGSDFMGGRYGIATEHINPANVVSVDILENHQPMQVLKGLEYSQQAGLNIKLKEEARHQWIAMFDGGIGVCPFLYDASAFAMRIAGKWQSLETVRANNTGWNPASQSRQHIGNCIFGNGYADMIWDDYINIGISNLPIDGSRTRDNVSILANTSNAWRIGNGKDLRFNLTYERDRLNHLTGHHTDYFDDKLPSFIEQNSMCTETHRLSGQWVLQVNRSDKFLKDDLYIDMDRNNALATIGGTLSRSQKAQTPSFSVTNDGQLVKRIADNLLTVSSRNRYIHKPHSLWITGEENVRQDVRIGDFRSVTEARYGRIFGRWRVNARGGIDLNCHGLESNLAGLKLPYVVQNDVDFLLLNTYLSPEASYKSYKWHVSLSVPVSYHRHRIRNRVGGEGVTNKYVAVTPSLHIRHQLSARMELAAQFCYSLTPPEVDMFVSGLMMTGFRNLYLSKSVAKHKDTRSVMMKFKYRNPITSLFFHAAGRYEWHAHPYLQSQLFVGNYILDTYEPIRNVGRNLSVEGSISKGIISGRLTIGLDADYTRVETSTIRQGIVSPYVLGVFSAQLRFKGGLTGWLSTDYRLFYSRNTIDIDTVGKSNYDALKQYLTFTFVPTPKWQIAIGGEHYYTKLSSGSSARLLLLDTSVRRSVSKRVDIRLSAYNLLDQRKFSYTTYGLLNVTEYLYRLRGRNVMASIQIGL